jgi:phenylacetic acid degradation operon negative regulatory protein
MIVTVFGDSVLPRGGRIWLGSLIGLLAPLGLADRLVRTAVFRLSQDDWLEAVVHGRRSDYRLTGSGRRRFVEASRHIYAAEPAPWDQRWRLITVTGELESDQRERLRRSLFWHGFGQLGADCFVHPSADLTGVFESLRSESLEPVLDRLLPLVAANPRLAASGKDADLVRRAWNLQGLDEAYRAFVDSYAPLLSQWQQADADPGDERAFLIRSLLIHDYRRLLLRDPELPGVLLPVRWAGLEARSLCRELYRLLLPASERHLDRHLKLADGQVPAASALLAERFGLSDSLLASA